ncbi:MAG: ArsC/Spx/MgsR family protein [Cryomorphaceae bacterium]
MKKILYLSSCDTCKRIMKETGADGFELQDIKVNPIDAETLDRLYAEHGSYEALFNKRAVKYRAKGLNQQGLSDDAYRSLILDEYTFLKRPVYIIGPSSFVGNSKQTVEAIKAALGE